MWSLDIASVLAVCVVFTVAQRWAKGITKWQQITMLVVLWTLLMVVASLWTRGNRPAYNVYDDIEGLVTGISLAVYLVSVGLAYVFGQKLGMAPVPQFIVGTVCGIAAILFMRYTGFYVFALVARFVATG